MDTLTNLNLDDLSAAQMHALVAVGIAVGTLYCFLGHRTIKFVIALTGFLLAGAVAAVITGMISEGHLLSMSVVGLIGGVCGAMALHFLYKVGIFVLGAVAAALIAHEALSGRPEAWIPIAVLGVGVGGGVIALFLERPVVMMATAAIGAWMLVAGIVYFLFNPEGMMEATGASAIEENELYIGLAWAGLGLLGAFTQWATRAKKAS